MSRPSNFLLTLLQCRTCSLCLQHGTSFLGQTGRKNAVLGRMEDSRSKQAGSGDSSSAEMGFTSG